MMASDMTYWNPNPLMLYHTSASSLLSAHWHRLAAPAEGVGSNTTFNSQPSFIFPLNLSDGTVLYIYMGDRWNFAGPGSVRNPHIDALVHTQVRFECNYHSNEVQHHSVASLLWCAAPSWMEDGIG
jgi:hypothetical protein